MESKKAPKWFAAIVFPFVFVRVFFKRHPVAHLVILALVLIVIVGKLFDLVLKDLSP